jgi:microsomal epoxide hydrolase
MPEPAGVSKTLSPLEQKGVTRATEFIRIGSAYALEHATKPSTLGIVLSSSPIALLAWYRNVT